MKSLAVILIVGFGLVLGEMRFIDLTHTWGPDAVTWPGLPQFNFSLAYRIKINDSIIVVGNQIQTLEHSGTHVDVPQHFCPGKKFVHQIPLEKLSGPGVVLDFTCQAEEDTDYKVTLQDIKDWESEYGAIPKGAVVLFNFGWSKYWPDAEKYFNSTDISNSSTFHFPGLRLAAARYLSETRKVHAVGVDTATPDLRRIPVPLVHINLLCEHGLMILENVNNLDAMPPTGSQVYIGAVKLENGSGAPVRLFATVDDDKNRDQTMEEVKFIDLTHTLGHNTVFWPGLPTYNFSQAYRIVINESIVVVGNQFQTIEHSGTHIDVPQHFCPDGKFLHEIPLEKLSGPGVVIDLKSQAEKDNDYKVTLQDIEDWEKKHKAIPEGAIVLFNFGWYKFWPNAEKVFQSKDFSNTSTFHFPGLRIDAAKYLSETRKVHAVGVDTPTPDLRRIPVPLVHINLLCEHGLMILENVNNLDAMPPTGSQVYIAAVKLENGSGAPVRLFATVPKATDGNPSGTEGLTLSSLCISLILSMITISSTQALGLCV